MLHIPLSRIAADPPALDDCVAYIESEARQAVEFRPGSLGISGADGPGGGRRAIRVGLASSEAMSASEETEAPLRAELAKRAGTPMLPIPARGREAGGQAAGPMHSVSAPRW